MVNFNSPALRIEAQSALRIQRHVGAQKIMWFSVVVEPFRDKNTDLVFELVQKPFLAVDQKGNRRVVRGFQFCFDEILFPDSAGYFTWLTALACSCFLELSVAFERTDDMPRAISAIFDQFCAGVPAVKKNINGYIIINQLCQLR